MTKLESEICRILNFPEKYLGVAKSEAVDKAKLRNTWMYLNGKLSYIHAMELSGSIVVSESKVGEVMPVQVETLEAFVPQAGLYATKGGLLSVTKKAAKSWAKSFKPDNYRIFDVNTPKRKILTPDLIDLSETACELITGDGTGKIWVYGVEKEVASLGIEEVVVFNSKYYQEVLDYVTRKGLECSVNLQ